MKLSSLTKIFDTSRSIVPREYTVTDDIVSVVPTFTCPKSTLFGTADMIVPFFSNQDNRRFFRVLLSKIFTFLVNFISGYRIPYYNGPVLHLRYNVMRWSPDTHGYAYQAELITRILSEGATYKTVKIKNQDRVESSSNAK